MTGNILEKGLLRYLFIHHQSGISHKISDGRKIASIYQKVKLSSEPHRDFPVVDFHDVKNLSILSYQNKKGGLTVQQCKVARMQ